MYNFGTCAMSAAEPVINWAAYTLSCTSLSTLSTVYCALNPELVVESIQPVTRTTAPTWQPCGIAVVIRSIADPAPCAGGLVITILVMS